MIGHKKLRRRQVLKQKRQRFFILSIVIFYELKMRGPKQF